ncbi:MAG: hypothetical protein L6311_06900 [Cellulomonas sp.]|nr:hypothetical protein [Cellulomonas sp.]
MSPKGLPRMQDMTAAEVRIRAEAAQKFVDVAAMVHTDVSDPSYPQVTGSLAVLAGIAASDAVCGHVLKQRPKGQDHKQAVDVLTSFREGESLGATLGRLLDQKNNAHYGTTYLTRARAEAMLDQARRMVERMDEILQSR